MTLISESFKNLFNKSIDELLKKNALTSLCTLKFTNFFVTLCDNCIYDNISKNSSGYYNNIGPIPFESGSVCPVCMGQGSIKNNSNEYDTYLAVIFDSKYFINISNSVVNIPNSSIQTICSTKELSFISTCSELIVKDHPTRIYERASEPMLCGLGNLDYIITMWNKK
jgi:hypothetical protein